MDDDFRCDDCGSSKFETIVHYGSYISACATCRQGPTTSFMAVAPALTGIYRATLIDDDWRHLEQIYEGQGVGFVEAVRIAAQSGSRVLIRPIADGDRRHD
ncbi:MAG: hypothetical protein ACT6Q3_04655 [Sphingopyxis sp.]